MSTQTRRSRIWVLQAEVSVGKSKVNAPRAVAAGLAAGSAYLAAMWVDSKVSSHPFNDLKLVGQMFTTRSPAWQVQGLVGHYGFSAVMGLLYAGWAYDRLPGPPWLRGVFFLQIENAGLYPSAVFIDRFHAGMRSGQLPPLSGPKSFAGQIVRHLAFGVTLGALYRP